MALNATPELGISLDDDIGRLDLPERTAALSKTVNTLEDHGLDITPDEIDKEVAATLATAYAQAPSKTSQQVTNTRAATLTPPSIRLANNILEEFNHSVVESSVQLRHLVTNKFPVPGMCFGDFGLKSHKSSPGSITHGSWVIDLSHG